jgi:Uma2 family endonuclease
VKFFVLFSKITTFFAKIDAIEEAYPMTRYSPDEYIQIEEHSLIKHEFVDGRLYAMVGTSKNHNTISGNLFTALKQCLRGSSCQVFFADIKVRIEQRNCFFYPDLAVSCDSRDREDPLYLRFPKLIVEVLSTSTEAYDRGDKFRDYQTIETLEEYVLISSRQRLVQCFRRNDEGRLWVLHSYDQEQGVYQLASMSGFSRTLEELYEDVSF